MATGASKAEREAKKQAQAQYWKALNQTQSMTEASKIDSQGARKLGDQLGNDMSAQSKSLARKSDQLARKLNPELAGFNEQVGRFNNRYDALKRQMNGESVTAYRVTANSQSNTTDSMATAIEKASGYGGTLGKTAADYDFIYDKDEAYAKSAEASKAYQNSLTPAQKAMSQYQGMGKEYLTSGLNSSAKNPLAGTHLAAETMSPITESYRSLSQTKQAYNDLSALGQQVSNTNFAQYADQYESIGQRLKQSVARDVRIAQTPAQGGLLQSEIISGNGSPIDNEVIRA